MNRLGSRREYFRGLLVTGTSAVERVDTPFVRGSSDVLTRWREGLSSRGIAYVFQRLSRSASPGSRARRFWSRQTVRFGSRVRVDGCEFDLAQPGISDRFAAGFAHDNYEMPERRCLARLNPDLDVIELGGSIGVLACLINRRIARPQRHFVVEANPRLARVLERHRAMNRCRFHITQAAIAYGTDTVSFRIEPSPVIGRVVAADDGPADEIVVAAAMGIEQIVRSNDIDRCVVVMDIEGSEVEVFANEIGVFANHVDQLLVEFHPHLTGQASVDTALRALADAGLHVAEQHETSYFFERTDRSLDGEG